MIGIPFINDLFSAILVKSKVINGRFYICPFFGQELNKGNIAEIVSWVEPYLNTKQKYPAALLMPMTEVGNFQYQDDNSVQNAYSYFECCLAFITNAYVTGQNQVSSPTPDTNQPSHSVPDTWHDMARCAKDFMIALFNGIGYAGLTPAIFISESHKQSILPVTNKGNDMVSGVLMKFYIAVASGCDLEDYNDDYLTEIQWPAIADSHPLHLDV